MSKIIPKVLDGISVVMVYVLPIAISVIFLRLLYMTGTPIAIYVIMALLLILSLGFAICFSIKIMRINKKKAGDIK